MTYKIWKVARRSVYGWPPVHTLRTIDTEEAAEAFLEKAKEALVLLDLADDLKITKEFIIVHGGNSL